MRYWDDMLSKWGFNDGDAVHEVAVAMRPIYIRTVNDFAWRLGSNVAAYALDGGGSHNTLLVDFARRAVMEEAIARGDETADSIENGVDFPLETDEIPLDEAMREAIDLAADLRVDDFVTVHIQLEVEEEVLRKAISDATHEWKATQGREGSLS